MEKTRRRFSILDFGLPIGKRGQSIIEYLVVAAAVILAIIAFSTGVQSKVQGLGNSAGNQLDAASNTITNQVVANEH